MHSLFLYLTRLRLFAHTLVYAFAPLELVGFGVCARARACSTYVLSALLGQSKSVADSAARVFVVILLYRCVDRWQLQLHVDIRTCRCSCASQLKLETG